MAYEQKPKEKKAVKAGVRSVDIQKLTGDAEGLMNSQLQWYESHGYKLKEERFKYVATIDEDVFRETIEKPNHERAIRQVEGTKNITPEERREGMFKSTITTGEPTTISDFLGDEE